MVEGTIAMLYTTKKFKKNLPGGLKFMHSQTTLKTQIKK